MSIDKFYHLIPQEKNFKPTAQQMNELFDALIEKDIILTYDRRFDLAFPIKRMADLPIIPLTEQQMKCYYQKIFNYYDSSHFFYIDRINEHIVKNYEAIQKFYYDHILYTIERMRPIREMSLQHARPILDCLFQYVASTDDDEFESTVKRISLESNVREMKISNTWIDFHELDDIDINDSQSLKAISPYLDFFTKALLELEMLSLGSIAAIAPIEYQPVFLKVESRYPLIEAICEVSTQILFSDMPRIGLTNSDLEMFWGFHATYKHIRGASFLDAYKDFRRFTYTERRTFYDSYSPDDWLNLPDTQTQIQILKEVMGQEFDFYYQDDFVCHV